MVFFFQAEDGIRDLTVTGVQTCALPIWYSASPPRTAVTIMSIESSSSGREGFHDHRRPLAASDAGGTQAETLPPAPQGVRSEEHTSELQSQSNLVCRLLLEKKKRTSGNL